MDGALAKMILQAILTRAEGLVGTFVDLRELAAQFPFGNSDAAATIDELLARSWIYRKGDYVAVSKPGVEYAIDWTLADIVLTAIAKAADARGGTRVSYGQVISMAGLPSSKTDELMAELAVLGLAGQTTLDGSNLDGAYISREGLSRLACRNAVA